MIQKVTITTETIKQANDRPRPKGGRPRKDEPKGKQFKLCSYHISDDAAEAIKSLAERLGVTQSALIEALGRTIAKEEETASAA